MNQRWANKQILVIDDEENILRSIQNFLEDYDFRLLTAVNGKIGLEVFDRHHPDLVLVDLQMPEVGGLEVIKRLKTHSPETPVIVISGTGILKDAVDALRMGAWDYLLKPINDMMRLLQAVNNSLERAQLLRENRNYKSKLEARKAELELLLNNIETQIWYLKTSQQYGAVNRAHARFVGKKTDEMEHLAFSNIYPPDQMNELIESNQSVFSKKKQIHTEQWLKNKDGQKRLLEIIKTPKLGKNQEVEYVVCSGQDITDQRLAAAQLEQLNKKLLDTAHQAGKAELATEVLHNVGNVLNSLNIKAETIYKQSQNSAVNSLPKVVDLMNQHADDLPGYLTKHPKGKRLLEYFNKFVETVSFERRDLDEQMGKFMEYINSINSIISMQQAHARIHPLVEPTSLSNVIEDALKITDAKKYFGSVSTQLDTIHSLMMLRQQVLQILVNLITNAKDAVRESGPDSSLKIIMSWSSKAAKISITDNGKGIRSEDLTNIFGSDFTTKPSGHGLGLHYAANTAKQMGGSLEVQSDGLGQGATFTLTLPINTDLPE